MAGTFHGGCVWWLSKAYPVMLEDNFIVRPRTSARALLRGPPAAPTNREFMTEENKCMFQSPRLKLLLLTQDSFSFHLLRRPDMGRYDAYSRLVSLRHR